MTIADSMEKPPGSVRHSRWSKAAGGGIKPALPLATTYSTAAAIIPPTT